MPAERLRSVRSPFEPLTEVCEVSFQLLAVVLPRFAIDPGCRLSLQLVVGLAQPPGGIDMVQERGEPHLPISPCGVSYPLERAARTLPALRPACVTLKRVPFGHLPSLHLLRGRSPGVVRWLLGYYGGVRLPVTVHHRCASSDFPMRSGPQPLPDDGGISRFPCKMHPYMLRVFDRAGSARLSRWRGDRCGFPHPLTASAPGSDSLLSRLNGWPARSPVNASPSSSRTTAHDSGSMWIATPFIV